MWDKVSKTKHIIFWIMSKRTLKNEMRLSEDSTHDWHFTWWVMLSSLKKRREKSMRKCVKYTESSEAKWSIWCQHYLSWQQNFSLSEFCTQTHFLCLNYCAFYFCDYQYDLLLYNHYIFVSNVVLFSILYDVIFF